jgi:SAM-dependent methyltransferase
LQPETDTVRFYESHVRRYGYGYRALGFGRRSSQNRRFAAAAAVGDLHGKRVLDMGCGFGDFLAWLHERGVRPQYTGVDICAPMVERCLQRFASRDDARFLIGDALTWTPDSRTPDSSAAEAFDYVIASGIFGYASADAQKRVRPTLTRLFAMSRIGLSVNFLSKRATTRSAARLYLRPADVLDFALSLTPSVRLDHTYMPNDFTLSLYRTPAWKEQSQ